MSYTKIANAIWVDIRSFGSEQPRVPAKNISVLHVVIPIVPRLHPEDLGDATEWLLAAPTGLPDLAEYRIDQVTSLHPFPPVLHPFIPMIIVYPAF